MNNHHKQNQIAAKIIIIVENEPICIKQLQACIEDQYQVVTLSSSIQVMDYLRQSAPPWPALILVAWNLLTQEGLAVLTQYAIPIIVQGNPEPDSERLAELFAQGVIDYWQMPLPKAVIQQRLQHVLWWKTQEQNLTYRNRDFDILAKLLRFLDQTRHLDQILKYLVADLGSTLGLDEGLIFIITPDKKGLCLEAEYGLTQCKNIRYRPIAPESDLAGQTAFERRTIILADRLISIPLMAMGHVVGVIQFRTNSARTPEAVDISLLEAIAAQIAIIIENRSFQVETQRPYLEIVELYHTIRKISQAANLRTVYQEIFNFVAEEGINHSAIWLFDQFHRYGNPFPQQAEVVGIWQKDNSTDQLEQMTFSLADTEILQQLKRTEPLLIDKTETDLQLDQVKPSFIRDRSGANHLAFIPMSAQDTWIGIVILGNINRNQHSFSPERLRFYWELVNQAAMVIINLHLLQDAQRQSNELQVLNQMSQAFVSTLDPQEVLQTIIEQVSSILPVDVCSVFLVEKSSGDLTLEASLHLIDIPEALRRIPKGRGIVGWVIEHRQPQNVASVFEDSRYYSEIGQVTNLKVGSIICAPIIRSDSVIGAIQGINAKTGAFKNADLQLLIAAANHAAVALDNAQLHEETVQRLSELSLLQVASIQLTSTIKLKDLIELVVTTAKTIVPVDAGCVLLLKDDNPSKARLFMPESEKRVELVTITIHPNSLTQKILKSGTVMTIADRQMVDTLLDNFLQRDWRTLIGVPLKINNQPRGVLYLNSLVPRQFSKHEIVLLETFVNQATLAIDHAMLYQETSENLKRISVLYKVAQTARYFHNRTQVLKSITTTIRHYFHANPVLIFALSKADSDTLEPYYMLDVPAAKLLTYQKNPWRLSESFFQSLLCGNHIHIHHLQMWQHEDFRSRLLYPEAASWYAAPLQIEDQVVGIIVLIGSEPVLITEEAAEFLDTLAGHIAVVLENIHLVNKLEAQTEALQQANQELRTANEIKSRFFATMSHELRTPLNSILGYGEILQEELDGPLTPNQLDAVERVVRNGRNLLLLIEDILDLSKINVGMLHIQLERFALYQAIDEALDVISPLAAQKGLSLMVEPFDDDIQVYADIKRVHQVLVNLLSNAIKFTYAGQVTLKVDTIGSEYVSISITDTGIGISRPELDQLFVEFYQVDSSTTREYGGTGLGLTITKRLLKLMGGDIEVDSEIGEGSTFIFTLPRFIGQPD